MPVYHAQLYGLHLYLLDQTLLQHSDVLARAGTAVAQSGQLAVAKVGSELLFLRVKNIHLLSSALFFAAQMVNFRALPAFFIVVIAEAPAEVATSWSSRSRPHTLYSTYSIRCTPFSPVCSCWAYG